MTEEKNEVIFDDDKISKSEEFVNPDELYQELIQCVQKYHPSDDISMIEKAYKVAKRGSQKSVPEVRRTLYHPSIECGNHSGGSETG